MIDYSISDPTKQIWINLELYIESYDFYNLYEFFWNLYEFISIFKRFKLIKNKAKIGAFIARTHVDATWQARPRGRATRTHASACVAHRWHIYLIFIIHRL